MKSLWGFKNVFIITVFKAVYTILRRWHSQQYDKDMATLRHTRTDHKPSNTFFG